MKKFLIILMLFPLVGYAADRAGRENTITVGDLLGQFYLENFNNTTAPYKICDSTSALTILENAGQATLETFDACKRDTTINMVATVESYSLPSDFLRIRYVRAIAKSTAYEIVMKEMLPTQVGLFRDAEGIPGSYFVDDITKIHLEPANTSGDTVRVYYVPSIAAMDSVQDTTNIDRAYKNYLVLEASERFWGGYDASNPANAAKAAKRLEKIKELKGQEIERLAKYNVGKSVLEDIMK